MITATESWNGSVLNLKRLDNNDDDNNGTDDNNHSNDSNYGDNNDNQ